MVAERAARRGGGGAASVSTWASCLRDGSRVAGLVTAVTLLLAVAVLDEGPIR